MDIGKLPPELVSKYIYSRMGSYDPAVLIGPSLGEDAAIIRVGNRYLAMHVDPISGSLELLGWLAVHVVSNDIAVRGLRPRWLMPTIMLPPSVDESVIDVITEQMDHAAREVGASIVGGHTEVTTAVSRPVVVMAAVGEGDRYVATGGARPGDLVLMTKSAALEAAAILATDFKDMVLAAGVPREVVERAQTFAKYVSVVREALAISDLATAMHDPTEGGVVAGLAEVAYASSVTIIVRASSIKIAPETAALCSAAGLDPLYTLSSGALIATVPAERVDEALERLRRIGVEANVIGEVVPRGSYLLDGDIKVASPYVRDKLFELFIRQSAGRS
ncbi:AIR synthase family protein [Thermoproteus tenax]|uniref:Hydrogenase expression/formation protein n=1 Tax=Thermoproteus tenax (strain ATCC 35583 / DSM 2078 / JCM 9277 / NBRC 100435 / Kra 1) TaxID=768679 RepID=G4RLP3_THETK|nr:AIR synthase family protein [Thermoproteus tenax]CCC82488.1 hydrogenase expression/formation protein [Thermoproteus tenax Kra 1]